tara:strand:+ start:307 stop:612 length:306 start_codon:yes stop_codon:yes gene_type:complete
MKITKTQLKEIIKEELEAVLEGEPEELEEAPEPESEDPGDAAVRRAIARIEKETGLKVGLSHLPKPKLAKVPYEEPYVPTDPLDARYGRYGGRTGKGKLGS